MYTPHYSSQSSFKCKEAHIQFLLWVSEKSLTPQNIALGHFEASMPQLRVDKDLLSKALKAMLSDPRAAVEVDPPKVKKACTQLL